MYNLYFSLLVPASPWQGRKTFRVSCRNLPFYHPSFRGLQQKGLNAVDRSQDRDSGVHLSLAILLRQTWLRVVFVRAA